MRITWENNTQQNTERVTTAYSTTRTKECEQTGAFTADISGTVMDNNAYGVQGRTAEDVMQEAQGMDVATQRNYMAVMSNSMSTEDFSKMLAEGVNPGDTEIDTVVTIVDRIKAELVKSGVSVTGYTDNLDTETLTKIVGSESLARQLCDSFLKNDIPVTKENAEAAMQALNEARLLTSPTDGEFKYLVSNQLEPTIGNLYMAEHSGAVDANRQGKGYYPETYGYFAKKADTTDFDKLLPQMEKIIANAGLSVTDETIAQAGWLVEKGIPLTSENLSILNRSMEISFPLQAEAVLQAIATAITEGESPLQADLNKPQNKYEKATELSDMVENWLQEDSLSITARRRLEEVRLRMSAEVNVRLAESGFTIDTSDMEALVEALKEAEKRQAQRLFPGQEQGQDIENLHLYQETLAKTALLPGLPAAVLGRLVLEEKQTVNVENLAGTGSRLQADYRKAGEAYETLMTAPRYDLGDSIRKAFANVDAILEDLNFELTAENQRAVRILSYNRLPITPENLEQIRTADRRVQRVIQKMTPASTLQMIRDGVNPLSTDMEELEQYFKDRGDDPVQEMETYSRYLHRLEKNREISKEERDAYIGVYRMLRQIEKSDGAVIGSVLKAQSELNFKQLLTAARTAKKAGMNILVDESFGGLRKLQDSGNAIDRQIDAINRLGQNLPEEEQADFAEELETIRNLKQADDEIIRTLNRLDFPITANSVMAAVTLSESANPLFHYLKKELDETPSGKAENQEQTTGETEEPSLFEQLTATLTEALTDRESMQEAYSRFDEQITGHLQEKLYTPGQTALDIKTMKSARMQLSIAAGMAREETYEIPMLLQDGVASIRLTIRHSEEERGQAAISLETEELGKIQAFLQVQENRATGYLTGNGAVVKRLEAVKGQLEEAFERKHLQLTDFRVMESEGSHFSPKLMEGENKTPARIVYEAAREVIKALQEQLL